MSRFHKTGVVGGEPTTTNLSGGAAAQASPQLALYNIASTSVLGEKALQTAGAELAEVQRLVPLAGQEFTVKLAAMCREQLNLRTMPIILLVEAAAIKGQGPTDGKSVSVVREWVPRIVKRGDEPLEVLGYWLSTRGEKTNFPNALRMGIIDVIEKFDEYVFSKYERAAGKTRYKHLLRILHPKPRNEERAELYRKIIKEELAPADTWETRISGGGSTAENWDEAAKTMGVMALLRNLRNLEQAEAHGAIEIAIGRFGAREAVLRSKQFPFRWLSAAQHVQSPTLRDAVMGALEISADALPKLPGTTVILVDGSFSMEQALSPKTSVSCKIAANILAAMATRMADDGGELHVIKFGEWAQRVLVSRHDSVMTVAKQIGEVPVGHATMVHLAVEKMISLGIEADRVLLLSDMQCYSRLDRDAQRYTRVDTNISAWARYRSLHPKARMYSMNLSANDTTLQFHEGDPSVSHLAGWSDKMLHLIPALDRGESGVDIVNRYR